MSSEHAPGPWEIDWYVCVDDQVEEPGHEPTGEELWRVPRSIGPITIDHDHWAGWHLDVEPRIARLVAAVPAMQEALREFVACCDEGGPWLTEMRRFVGAEVEQQARDALRLAEGDER